MADERRRIARDVHDLVAHGLAAVLLQVSSARHVLRRDPDEADLALRSAEEVGRRNLAELRATVALLRSADEAAGAALPGLEQLPRLVAETRAAGLEVSYRPADDLHRVPAAAGLTLYRVAQEALVNAGRYAPRSDTVVATRTEPGTVELTVHSRAPLPVPRDRRRPGYGLVGMRERAVAAGGELHAGPVPDGWLVRCALPLGARPAGRRAAVPSHDDTAPADPP